MKQHTGSGKVIADAIKETMEKDAQAKWCTHVRNTTELWEAMQQRMLACSRQPLSSCPSDHVPYLLMAEDPQEFIFIKMPPEGYARFVRLVLDNIPGGVEGLDALIVTDVLVPWLQSQLKQPSPDVSLGETKTALTAMLDSLQEPLRSVVTMTLIEWQQEEAVRILEAMPPEKRSEAMAGAEQAMDMVSAQIRARVSTTPRQ